MAEADEWPFAWFPGLRGQQLLLYPKDEASGQKRRVGRTPGREVLLR